MEFFNDYIMFRLFFDDKKVPPRNRRPTVGPGTAAASRRESMVDLRRMSACPGTPSVSNWRQSSWDMSQQLRLPIRQRLMRKRSGSWSGPPSGSSSHHLLAIEEEEKPTSPNPGKLVNKHLAQFMASDRKWSSLDCSPPIIQVTQADKEEGARSPQQQTVVVEESTVPSATPKLPEPSYTSITTAGMAAMLRIKQKLARKRSGSLPEERLVLSEADRTRLTSGRLAPPGHLSADATLSQTPAASPTSSSPIGKFVRRSTGSLPGPGTLSPRLLTTGQSPTLTLSPIASPSPSALPTPTDILPPHPFPQTVTSSKYNGKRISMERRKTVADLGGRGSKVTPASHPSISSLLDIYLEKSSENMAAENEADEPADEEDNVVLDLGYKYGKKKQQKQNRRATCAHVAMSEANDPPTADLIHFSSSTSNEEAERRDELPADWSDEGSGEEVIQEESIDLGSRDSIAPETRELKEAFQKITTRRPFAPSLANMASKLRRTRGWPKRGDTLPEIQVEQPQTRDEYRKSSVPLPPRRNFRRLLQHQRPCASQEVSRDDREQSALVRRLSSSRQGHLMAYRNEGDENGRRKSSAILAPPMDPQVMVGQQKQQSPSPRHIPSLKLTKIHESLDKNWTDIPKMLIVPEMPDRSQSSASVYPETIKTTKPTAAERRRHMSANSTKSKARSMVAQPDYPPRPAPVDYTVSNVIKPKEKPTSQAEISVALHYSQAIGFLTVMINQTKNMPELKNVFLRIMRFESDCLVESTQTSITAGKFVQSDHELKQAYMFGMDESKLLITHLVIELWECNALNDNRRFGHVVIGPHAGGTGCLQWTRMVKNPNFPSSVWHQIAQTEN